jgi:hypothetical protein
MKICRIMGYNTMDLSFIRRSKIIAVFMLTLILLVSAAVSLLPSPLGEADVAAPAVMPDCDSLELEGSWQVTRNPTGENQNCVLASCNNENCSFLNYTFGELGIVINFELKSNSSGPKFDQMKKTFLDKWNTKIAELQKLEMENESKNTEVEQPAFLNYHLLAWVLVFGVAAFSSYIGAVLSKFTGHGSVILENRIFADENQSSADSNSTPWLQHIYYLSVGVIVVVVVQTGFVNGPWAFKFGLDISSPVEMTWDMINVGNPVDWFKLVLTTSLFGFFPDILPSVLNRLRGVVQ